MVVYAQLSQFVFDNDPDPKSIQFKQVMPQVNMPKIILLRDIKNNYYHYKYKLKGDLDRGLDSRQTHISYYIPSMNIH